MNAQDMMKLDIGGAWHDKVIIVNNLLYFKVFYVGKNMLLWEKSIKTMVCVSRNTIVDNAAYCQTSYITYFIITTDSCATKEA